MSAYLCLRKKFCMQVYCNIALNISNCVFHYKSPCKMVDEQMAVLIENSFKTLHSAENCKLLIKKHLTKDVFDLIKSRKTSRGATLYDVIKSGIENLDGNEGIYAPDAESYQIFAPLFDPVIDEYHGGFGASVKQPLPDFGDFDQLANIDPEGKFIVSTRVRCARTLDGYPFNPFLTEIQYREIENIIKSALGTLNEEYNGIYYPLTEMNKATQHQLINDHYLFKEGDRFMQGADGCKHWPIGRGIFMNSDKTFLVWCNEEDHVRVISMQNGGNLKEVYSRFVKGLKLLEGQVKFARDERLGYLAFCPTNLGTTIRASVHVRLPKLSRDKIQLMKIATKFNLQVRGTRGEHTETEGGVYDISNKRTIGFTEFEAVKTMQDGVMELIEMEKAAS